jgi:hypothetical protein
VRRNMHYAYDITVGMHWLEQEFVQLIRRQPL